jgi:hypothetical protein
VVLSRHISRGPSAGIAMETTRRTSSKARASFYLGLISSLVAIPALFTRFYPLLALIALTAVSAIILGVGSRRQIRASSGLLVGSGRATAGMILSLAGLIIGFFLMPFT